MQEAKVRSRFAQRYRIQTGEVLHDFTWEQLCSEGFLDDVAEICAEGDARIDEQINNTLDHAQEIQERFLRYATAASTRKQASLLAPLSPITDSPQDKNGVPLPVPKLTDHEKTRAGAYAALIALEAARDLRVRTFRETYLGDPSPAHWADRPWEEPIPPVWREERRCWMEERLNGMEERLYGTEGVDISPCPGRQVLTPEAARRFLDSPALAHLNAVQLSVQGVPVLSHRSRLVTQIAARLHRPYRIVLLRWGTGRRERIPVPGGKALRWRVAMWDDAGDVYRERQQEYKSHSVHDRLREIAEALASAYYWPVPQAAWWVLTGQRAPVVSPIELSYSSDVFQQRISLTLSPWISPERLEEIYRPLYKWMHFDPNRTAKRERKADRGTRTYAVVLFVLARTDQDGHRPPWASLTREWNAVHPLIFKSEANFAGVYKRGIHTLQRDSKQVNSATA